MEEEEVTVAVDAAVVAEDAVTEEDRTTQAPETPRKVVSVQHLEAMCSTMDTRQLQTR